MTDLPELPSRTVRIEHVQFDADELVAAVLDGEGVAVPIRVVCAALDLDPETHSARLREHDSLAQGLRIVRAPLDGRMRSVLAILHTHIAYWLATIPPREVSDAARPKLVRYQNELVLVLHALYGPTLSSAAPDATRIGDSARITHELRTLRDMVLAALTDHQTQRAELTALTERVQSVEDVVEDLRQIAKISAKQAEYLQRAIKRLASRVQQRTRTQRNMYELLFAQFKIDLGIPRYDALAASRYDRALNWLQAKAQELLPDDPDALPPHQEQLL